MVHLRVQTCQLSVIAWMVAAAIAVGCRPKLDVHANNGPEAAKSKVSTKPTAMVLDHQAEERSKAFFQSRASITLEIDAAVLANTPSFTLINLTGAQGDDQAGVIILDQATANLGVAADGTWALNLRDGGSYRLTLYPLSKAWTGKFFYGLNTLKIIAWDPLQPRYATLQLTLRDFDVFAVNAMSFPSASETEVVPNGGLYEGWLSPLGAPLAEAGSEGPFLTEGMMNIVNGR